MTVLQLLTGTLETEILDGLQRMKMHAPEGAKRAICIHLRPDSDGSFVTAGYEFDERELDFQSHNNKNVTEAVDKLLVLAKDPKRTVDLRVVLEKRLTAIQAQLEALPAPEPVLVITPAEPVLMES